MLTEAEEAGGGQGAKKAPFLLLDHTDLPPPHIAQRAGRHISSCHTSQWLSVPDKSEWGAGSVQYLHSWLITFSITMLPSMLGSSYRKYTNTRTTCPLPLRSSQWHSVASLSGNQNGSQRSCMAQWTKAVSGFQHQLGHLSATRFRQVTSSLCALVSVSIIPTSQGCFEKKLR